MKDIGARKLDLSLQLTVNNYFISPTLQNIGAWSCLPRLSGTIKADHADITFHVSSMNYKMSTRHKLQDNSTLSRDSIRRVGWGGAEPTHLLPHHPTVFGNKSELRKKKKICQILIMKLKVKSKGKFIPGLH
jgi:hypothetical protein